MLDGTRLLVEDHDQSLALFHGDGDGFLEAVGGLCPWLQFIDHYFDVVVLVAIYLHAACDLQQLSIHADIQIALTAHRLEEFTIVAFSAAHQRGEDIDGFTGIVVHDHVEHFLLGIFHHLLTGGIAVGLSGPGKEQTQVIVDLSSGANGGTWILVSGLLLDADDG